MWTYRLHNDIGLSVRADLYFRGTFTGFSSKRRCDPANLQVEAQAVCDALNKANFANYRDFWAISLDLAKFTSNSSYI